MTKKPGWYNESRRHSLASRGIKTKIDEDTPIKKLDYSDDLYDVYEDYRELDEFINRDSDSFPFPETMYHLANKENLQSIFSEGITPSRASVRTTPFENSSYLAGTIDGCMEATPHRRPDARILEVDTRGIKFRIDPELYWYFEDGDGNILPREMWSMRLEELKGDPKHVWVYTHEHIEPSRIKKVIDPW